jgi:transposase
MQFIEGKNRSQSILFPDSLDQIIEQTNEVRLIDLFIESINIADYSFAIKESREGRPAYHPKDLLKLYVYGYLNRIRSSRQLERECKRNIELMWLMKQLTPDHNTVSNFRRDNEKAIRKVFRHTVSVARHFDLIGGTLVAGDSTKLRAQNSSKNNFNEAKIDRHLAYIESRLDEYNKSLAEADNDHKKQIIEQQIQKQNKRKKAYENLSNQIVQSGQTQISTSDPESRQLITGSKTNEISYNIQSVADAKHCIEIDYKVTNSNDNVALSGMLRRTKKILGTTDFTVLYDKGYHTGSEIKKSLELGINVMVAIPLSSSNAPDVGYNMSEFIYDEVKDQYRCPQNQILISNGTWYNKKTGSNVYAVKHYKTQSCKTCPVKDSCTKMERGRLIERSEYAPYIEINRRNIEANKEIYKKRQSIIEHPYGTIKRQWGFNYIMTKKGIKRASADVGFMFTAYNLRRIMNIVERNLLVKFLKELVLLFFVKMMSLNGFIFKIREVLRLQYLRKELLRRSQNRFQEIYI